MRNCWTKYFALTLALLVTLTTFIPYGFADSDAPSETPDIMVGDKVAMPVLTAGTTTELPIRIENLTHASMTSIIVTPVIDDVNKFPFEITNMGALVTRTSLSAKEKKTIYLPVSVLKTAESKVYTMNINFGYKTADGSSGTLTKTIYFKVVNGQGTPTLEIRKLTMEGGYIPAGMTRKVAFDVFNSSDMALKDVKVAFKDLGPGALLPAEDEQIEKLASLAPNKGGTVSFELRADNNLETKSYTQTLEISFRDEYDKNYTLEKKIYIPVRKSSDQDLNLGLEKIVVPTVTAGKEFTISFNLANRSGTALQNVTAKLETDAGMLAKSAAIQSARKVEAGASQPFTFKLLAKSDLESKSYPVKAVITYEVGTGTEQKTYYEYLNVDVSSSGGKTTPKVIVSNYSYGEGPVMANEAFPLKLTFTNTNQGKPIYNTKITLVPAESIFTPVNASNAFYIGTIGGGASVNREVSLMADFAAKPKNYPIEVKIDYEDEEGKAYSLSDTISVPVSQELVPKLSKIDIPAVSTLNTPTQMSLTIYNIGRAEIRNIFVNVAGENLVIDGGEAYLGTLGEGSDTYFDGTFTPTAVGEQKGTILITYQDGSGNEFQLTHEFTTTVEEMPPMDPGMEGMPVEEPEAPWIKWAKIGGGVLAGIIVLFAGFKFFKRWKARKQAEKL